MMRRGNLWRRPAIAALALLVVFVNGATPVRAASAAQQADGITTTYSMRIHPPPPPICAGREYRVAVEINANSRGIINGEQASFSEALYGVRVDAHTTNTSIATVSPDHDVTGDPELAAPNGVGAPAEVEFTLSAQKAGSTSLVLEAMVTRANNSYLGPSLPIRVVNCKFNVTLTSSWSFNLNVQGVPLYSHLAENSQGALQLVGSGPGLSGTANVEWGMSSYTPACSQAHEISPSSAHIEATPSEDGSTLSVRVTFDPATLTSTHCVGGETGQFAPPPIEFTVPSGGGSDGKDHSFTLGEENLHGFTTIQVTPVGQ